MRKGAGVCDTLLAPGVDCDDGDGARVGMAGNVAVGTVVAVGGTRVDVGGKGVGVGVGGTGVAVLVRGTLVGEGVEGPVGAIVRVGRAVVGATVVGGGCVGTAEGGIGLEYTTVIAGVGGIAVVWGAVELQPTTQTHQSRILAHNGRRELMEYSTSSKQVGRQVFDIEEDDCEICRNQSHCITLLRQMSCGKTQYRAQVFPQVR